MICDMSDVTMTDDNEEEKIPMNVAPTPSAAHNPKDSTTGDGHGFEATKMSKTSKTKVTSDILKMPKISEMAITLKNASSDIDLTKHH